MTTTTTTTTTMLPSSKDNSENQVLQQPLQKPTGDQYAKVVVASISGVFAGLLLTLIIFYLLKKCKCSGDSQSQDQQRRSLLDIPATRKGPSVLILYNPDSSAHQKTVVAFAQYLAEVFGVDVVLDVWERDTITNLGAITWCLETMETVDYIMTIWSVEARFKCSRDRPIVVGEAYDDYFSSSINAVVELINRAKNQHDGSLRKFVAVYFEYSSIADVSYRVDLATKFTVPKDLQVLYQHFHQANSKFTDDAKMQPSMVTTHSLLDNHHGRNFMKALNETKAFLRQNPNWFEEKLKHLQKQRIAKYKKQRGIDSHSNESTSICGSEETISISGGGGTGREEGGSGGGSGEMVVVEEEVDEKVNLTTKGERNSKNVRSVDSVTVDIHRVDARRDPLTFGTQSDGSRSPLELRADWSLHIS